MFRKYEDVIINLSQVQSVKKSGNGVEVVFINGKSVNISTNKYNHLLEGRYTKAKESEYNECIEKWQNLIIISIYETLKIRG